MRECIRAREAADAALARCWPPLDPDLRAHVARCDACAELGAVAAALREEHDAACGEPSLPPADRVWRRAVMDARLEAQRVAVRPIAAAQGLAGACAAGVMCAALTWVAPASAGWRVAVEHVVQGIAAGETGVAAASHFVLGQTLSLVLTLTACALLVPALWLLTSDD